MVWEELEQHRVAQDDEIFLGQCVADFEECAADSRSHFLDTANGSQCNQSNQQSIFDQILPVFATEE
jgi:hypothetical protein